MGHPKSDRPPTVSGARNVEMVRKRIHLPKEVDEEDGKSARSEPVECAKHSTWKADEQKQ